MSVCICKTCQNTKDSSEFYVKDKKTGRRDTSCSECVGIKVKNYKIVNGDKVSKCRKLHYETHKPSILAKNKLTRQLKKTEYYETKKIWRAENIDKVRSYRRKMKSKRKENDILYRFKENLRCRYSIINKKKSFSKASKFAEYIGCGLEELRQYLASKFQEGMTWDNYGIKGWHIDHIIPLDSAKTEEDVIKLLHYTNLQPLWAVDNYRKKNKCQIL